MNGSDNNSTYQVISTVTWGRDSTAECRINIILLPFFVMKRKNGFVMAAADTRATVRGNTTVRGSSGA